MRLLHYNLGECVSVHACSFTYKGYNSVHICLIKFVPNPFCKRENSICTTFQKLEVSVI